mmetsp:Transcript_11920/g.24238  ORF Transcript_11920/g.24238 Transcript_11920/m.24238 type:complete len:802 (-) Transcript_11920:433-2838(-)
MNGASSNNGGGPSDRLPPQAPPHKPPSSSSSQRMRSGSLSGQGISNSTSCDSKDSHRSSSSRKASRSSSGRRIKSSSDGVRLMRQEYQQQQQQQQQPAPYQFFNYLPGMAPMPPNTPGYQPMMPPGMPPSYGVPPEGASSSKKKSKGRSHRQVHSFDYSSFPAPQPAIDPNRPMRPTLSGGAFPPRPQPNQFSAINEISSVMGSSSRNLQGGRSRSNSAGKPNFHRRTMSDSMANHTRGGPVQLPPMPMPNSPLLGPHGRNPSFGSAGGPPPHGSPFIPNRGVYMGGELGGETDAFLAQTMGGAKGSVGGRPRSHMRQNSVNLFMKSYKGRKQPKGCKDVLYAVLFVVQLVIIMVVGLKFGPDALVPTSEELGPDEGLQDDDALTDNANETVVLAYWNIIKMSCMCGAFAIVLSAFALAFMMAMSRRLVYVALVLSIGVSFAWGTIGIGISPSSFVPITGIIALMLAVGYMFVVWDRIPFASANLTTALAGVRDNLGLVGIAFFFQFLALVFSIYYSFTFVGLHDAMFNNDDGMELSRNAKIAIYSLLVISYYWTYQVFMHIVNVTVAGTIGSWWFDEPSALWPTFTQATYYNFGSICYGGLLVGFVQLLRQITEGLRPNRDESALMCLYECCLFFQEKIVTFVDELADSFTPWAFTYIGLYHYGLKDAGHKANELFEKRGWTRLVTDDLIPNILAMVGLVIGGLSGSFAVILQALDGHGLTSIGHPVLMSFLIGFMIGIVLSSVLFGIISSSVFAVIVCFAGSPVEFQRKHPQLSDEMRHAWREVWPGSLDMENAPVGIV